jgi:hypothetical protein
MKKLLALLLSLLCLIGLLVSCTGGTTSAPQAETPSETPTPEVEVEPVKIPFGLYEVTNTKDQVLCYDNKTFIKLDGETEYQRRCWTIESFVKANGQRGYVLYAGDLPKSALTVQKALPGGTTKVTPASATKPDIKQKFIMEDCGDGYYILKCESNEKFALSSKDGQVSLALTEEGGDHLKWKFRALTEGCDRYTEWRSEGGIFTVRMGPEIILRSKITSERLQQWANDMEKTYYSYIEFTGFTPYQHIIFKAYEQEEHPGYVMGDYMVISADMQFMYGDIAKMAQRDRLGVSDWNFLMLHELGHMFDWGRQWNFEGEAMTDIKIGYVMYDNQTAVAAPSEFGYNKYFGFDNLDDCYNEICGVKKMTDSYNIYRTAAIFNTIGKQDNWDAMKKTYHWFEESGWKAENRTQMLEKYVEKLTEYMGKDVRSMIDDTEWEIIVGRTQSDK